MAGTPNNAVNNATYETRKCAREFAMTSSPDRETRRLFSCKSVVRPTFACQSVGSAI